MSSYSSQIRIETNNDKKFAKWVDMVEKTVKEKIHMGLLDLPDEDYRLSFEKGVSVKSMADVVITDYHNFLNFF